MPEGARRPGALPRPGTAPGDLEQVRALVNSRDLEQGTDELATVAGLAAWLRRAGLLTAGSPEARVTEADLDQAVALREALRGVLRAHGCIPGRADPDAAAGQAGRPAGQVGQPASGPVGELRRVAAALATRLEVGEDGRIGLAPAVPGVPGALTRILLIAASAAEAGTWSRLKACAADDCQWAFYDRSPARTGCWCSMQVCGARAKSRAYRRRASGPGATEPAGPASTS